MYHQLRKYEIKIIVGIGKGKEHFGDGGAGRSRPKNGRSAVEREEDE